MSQFLATLSSGRSGTFLIHKILSLYPSVESHHEYCIEHTQKLSVLHRAGVVSEDHAALQLRETHGAGVWHSGADIFSDSSNKLSFLIPSLLVIFPQAKFIHLVRDGRRTVASYYHKLSNEAMVNMWVERLHVHLRNPNLISTLPLVKAAWWPIPDRWDNNYNLFLTKWNRWQRLCWFWQDVNRVILRDLGTSPPLPPVVLRGSTFVESVPDTQKYFVRLEDLTSNVEELSRLLSFLGLRWSDKAWNLCQTPQNVSEPVSYSLTKEQEAQYWDICGGMHRQLGYGDTDYEVKYRKEAGDANW